MEPIKIPPPKHKKKLHGSVIVFLILAGIAAILAIANWTSYDPNEKSEGVFGSGWESIIALFFGVVTLFFLVIAAVLDFIFRKK